MVSSGDILHKSRTTTCTQRDLRSPFVFCRQIAFQEFEKSKVRLSYFLGCDSAIDRVFDYCTRCRRGFDSRLLPAECSLLILWQSGNHFENEKPERTLESSNGAV